MAYATVTELKAFLADPVSGSGASAGMITATGTAATDTRWTNAEMQAQLDAASSYIDGIFAAQVVIGATNTVARSIVLNLAAAGLLESCLPETMEGETRTRAYALRKTADAWVSKAKVSPSMLGTAKGPVYYV